VTTGFTLKREAADQTARERADHGAGEKRGGWARDQCGPDAWDSDRGSGEKQPGSTADCHARSRAPHHRRRFAQQLARYHSDMLAVEPAVQELFDGLLSLARLVYQANNRLRHDRCSFL
jgi:hypothetical protein